MAKKEKSLITCFTHFVSFDIPEWMLLEQVDDHEQLSFFEVARNGMFSLWVKIT